MSALISNSSGAAKLKGMGPCVGMACKKFRVDIKNKMLVGQEVNKDEKMIDEKYLLTRLQASCSQYYTC